MYYCIKLLYIRKGFAAAIDYDYLRSHFRYTFFLVLLSRDKLIIFISFYFSCSNSILLYYQTLIYSLLHNSLPFSRNGKVKTYLFMIGNSKLLHTMINYILNGYVIYLLVSFECFLYSLFSLQKNYLLIFLAKYSLLF